MPEHLRRRERHHIESYRRIGSDIILGEVQIDQDKCDGCSLCAATCPAKVLEVVDKKARTVADIATCFSCGCCAAICPENAIDLTVFLEFRGAFRYLDRGAPEFPRKF